MMTSTTPGSPESIKGQADKVVLSLQEAFSPIKESLEILLEKELEMQENKHEDKTLGIEIDDEETNENVSRGSSDSSDERQNGGMIHIKLNGRQALLSKDRKGQSTQNAKCTIRKIFTSHCLQWRVDTI